MSNFEIQRAAHKVLPVSLRTAKEFLNCVEADREDDLLLAKIKAATDCIEAMTNSVLITRDASYIYHGTADKTVSINLSPITSCKWVSVAFSHSDETKLMPFCLTLNTRCSPARLSLINHLRFPEHTTSMKICLTAGYGESPEDVPVQLRQAVMLMLAQLWEDRNANTSRPVPMMVDALLMPYRRAAA